MRVRPASRQQRFLLCLDSSRRGDSAAGSGALLKLKLLRLAERFSDLPMVTKWIKHAPDTPAPLIRHRPDFFCARRNRPAENGVRIGHGQNNPRGTAVQSLRTEIVVTRGLVSQPEFRPFNRK